MDSIDPIAPGPPAISGASRVPVERLERVSRERDRRAKDGQERRRREQERELASEQPPEDDGRPHIDVRA